VIVDKQEQVAHAIQDVITTMMDKVMERVLISDPFIKEYHRLRKPLYAALVPDEIFKGSHFERRFVTPFGSVWEKLAQIVALEAHGNCQMGYAVNGFVGQESLRRIQEILNQLEHHHKDKPKLKRNWQAELEYVKAGKGIPIPVTVICDIFIENQDNQQRYAFELKAPLPNSDQTKVSKEKLFKILAMEPKLVDEAYFALPYNHYGKRENYQWSFPMRWFDMHHDQSVLMGSEFWDLVGGEGTYENLVKIINALSTDYKARIYREFLGIEPPDNVEEGSLK
jgi:hypothetical protein